MRTTWLALTFGHVPYERRLPVAPKVCGYQKKKRVDGMSVIRNRHTQNKKQKKGIKGMLD